MRLLEKMKARGIGGKILLWIQKWLTGRRQRVEINEEQSAWIEVTSGVPQGSVVGSTFLLFLLMTWMMI